MVATKEPDLGLARQLNKLQVVAFLVDLRGENQGRPGWVSRDQDHAFKEYLDLSFFAYL